MNGKTVRISPAAQECISKLHDDFETKLADDLHTPSILNSSLQEAYRFMNTSINMLKARVYTISIFQFPIAIPFSMCPTII